MKVFVSHSFEDKAKFDDVCLALEQGGVPYWNPDDMPAGTSLRDELRLAISECPLCVFVATRNSLESGWCQAEIGAFWGAGKPVVVYLADTSIAAHALPKQFQGDKYATGMREVLSAAKLHLIEAEQDRYEQPTLVGEMTVGALVGLLSTISGDDGKTTINDVWHNLTNVLKRHGGDPGPGTIVSIDSTPDLVAAVTPHLVNLLHMPLEVLRSAGRGPWEYRFGVQTTTGAWTGYGMRQSTMSGVEGYLECLLIHGDGKVVTASAAVAYVVDAERSPSGFHIGDVFGFVGSPELGQMTAFGSPQ